MRDDKCNKCGALLENTPSGDFSTCPRWPECDSKLQTKLDELTDKHNTRINRERAYRNAVKI